MFFDFILIFLLRRQITWQATRQVVAVFCISQTFKHDSQIILHVSPHHLATLDHRVHERIVPGGPLAADVPDVLQVHLYPTHHLLAHVVRQFEVAAFQHPPHRLPLSLRVFQFLLEHLVATSIARQTLIKKLYYPIQGIYHVMHDILSELPVVIPPLLHITFSSNGHGRSGCSAKTRKRSWSVVPFLSLTLILFEQKVFWLILNSMRKCYG